MNCVLNAWAECVGNDDAGTRAEHILNLMENKVGEGDLSMSPNYRSYNLVTKTWSKSKVSNKAEKALGVLQRAKNCYKQQKLDTPPPEYTYSLVIHACAFSDSTDPIIEKKAFKIAVGVMNELINDVPAIRSEPSSATYGWFFQVCSRLQIPELLKEPDLKRLFSRCCDKGRVNDFVLQSVKQASSDALFAQLVTERLDTIAFATNKNDRPRSKQAVLLSHLPKSWVAAEMRTQTKSRDNSKVVPGRKRRQRSR